MHPVELCSLHPGHTLSKYSGPCGVCRQVRRTVERMDDCQLEAHHTPAHPNSHTPDHRSPSSSSKRKKTTRRGWAVDVDVVPVARASQRHNRETHEPVTSDEYLECILKIVLCGILVATLCVFTLSNFPIQMMS
jgi:hypothetical protein